MKRSTGLCLLLAVTSGCMSDGGRDGHGMDGMRAGHCCGGMAPNVPGVQGAWGAPVPMAAPYAATPPSGEAAARAMMANSVPLDALGQPGLSRGDRNILQATAAASPDAGSGIMLASATEVPGAPSGVNYAGGPMMAPPPGMPAPPGGIMPASGCCGPKGLPVPAIPGAVAAVNVPPPPGPAVAKRTEVRFASPAGMKVSWYGYGPDGRPGFSSNQVEVPGRYNFIQGAIYRLKLTDIPNRPGVDLYPTLEVVPSSFKTDAFIAHSAVPVFFTEEDFDQVAAGNYLVKVIYLPFPQYQDIATVGPNEIVSTRLEPGVDPSQEALKRGSILLIVRVGNIDLEAPNTPPMDAPPNGGGMAGLPPGAAMYGPPPGLPPGVMAGPGGPLMAPPPMAPNHGPVPAIPAMQPPQAPANPGVPVTRLPDSSPVQPVSYRYMPSPAQMAGGQ